MFMRTMQGSRSSRAGNEAWRGNFVLFWKPPSVFGQWTPSRFEVEGQWYGCPDDNSHLLHNV